MECISCDRHETVGHTGNVKFHAVAGVFQIVPGTVVADAALDDDSQAGAAR